MTSHTINGPGLGFSLNTSIRTLRPVAPLRQTSCRSTEADGVPASQVLSPSLPPAPVPISSGPPQQYAYPYPVPVPADSSAAVAETAAVATPYHAYDPRLYQGAPVRQDYYTAAPMYYPPPPPPYQKPAEATTGAPWWIWLGAGVLLGQVLAKVQEFMKNPKTPQQMMAEMAMKQMMGAMGNNAAPPGPFGAAGPGAGPFGANSPFPFPPPPSAAPAAVDTTATQVPPSSPVSAAPAASAPSSTSSSDGKTGEKFASRLNSEGREPVRVAEPARKLEVVEPVVKEPSPSSASSSTSAPRKGAFFDVTETTASPSSSSSNGAGESGSVMTSMMEQMLRNPEMQKMMYPYLPEPMRNPQSIEWMLNNPEVKKQMEQMFAQQNMMSPQMMEMMKGMDFNQDKVNKQFAELGLKPEDVIQKVMANPDLASGFSNPKVQAAVIDISQNPMNITKYQNDPEVMKVLETITTVFQPNVAPEARR